MSVSEEEDSKIFVVQLSVDGDNKSLWDKGPMILSIDSSENQSLIRLTVTGMNRVCTCKHILHIHACTHMSVYVFIHAQSSVRE